MQNKKMGPVTKAMAITWAIGWGGMSLAALYGLIKSSIAGNPSILGLCVIVPGALMVFGVWSILKEDALK
jgi:hypothetical protein